MSNAPCLHTDPVSKKKCYNTVSAKGGYCDKHQPAAFYNYNYQPDKDWLRKSRYIMQKYKGICHICGESGSDQVDHVIPKEEGGSGALFNLRPIHSSVAPFCHRYKTADDANRVKRDSWSFVKRGRGPRFESF